MSFFKERYKAVIFDLDGVIINSEPIHMEVSNSICCQWGKPHTWEEYAQFIGKTDEKIWSIIKQKYQLDLDVDQLVAVYSKKLTDYFLQAEELPMVDGISELLKTLHDENIKCAIGSASSHTNIMHTLNKIQNKEYFIAIASGDDIKRGKPYPDIFLRAASLLKVLPEDCAVIEDSACGVQAAKRAGMFCVGFRNPTSGNQDLSRADKIIGNMNELI